MNTNIKAVLFDMDGTLTDTETLAISIVHDQFLRRGYDIPHAELHTYTGKPPKDFFPAVVQGFDLPISSQELLQEFFDLYVPEVAKGVPFFHDVMPVLKSLHSQSYTMAVVSGSNRAVIENILVHNDAMKYFSFIIGIEDSVVGKPDPTGYLMAADKLGIPPEECLVVEDAVPGIQAGLNAHMRVVAVDRMGKLAESSEYARIETLEDLEKNL